ncbi:hypothetical protein E1J38_003370 [Seonamhaeicola sediminis]|uniref:Uncharacterized protein n=1 Tax=Seonamhaeicola sediminis TaxID=2528206 RepID=A0A562YG31_9FLAO|nr:hypothetical protein [Seonamhaeicola sediminis]TWO33827.1 hypothetical protein E1J38_003370 [Seonamhaeicola sediminis]
MIKSFIHYIILLGFMGVSQLQAQLGFCKGNSGSPIFKEDFGTGKGDSSLNKGSTTYRFTQGSPIDGSYKVSSNTNWYGWFITKDHTPNDNNGRCLIVNASYNSGEFFTIPISGLCENTTYEFSSWLINLFPAQNRVCGPSGNESANPINITFEIWDSTETLLLKKGNTGDIHGSYDPNWQQYGLVFKTNPGQESVILKMRNNGVGGCGNDLAIDDIVFKTCGDSIVIEDELKNRQQTTVSENNYPYSTTLTALPDFTVFSSHHYQWQKSLNGKDWYNIEGKDRNNISIKNLKKTTYYRVLVAEDAINVLNTSCHLITDYFKISVGDIIKAQKKEPKKPITKITKITTNPKPYAVVEEKEIVESTKFDRQPQIIEKDSLPNSDIDTNLLPKTYKEIIIVLDGNKVIKHKVWIDGAIGQYVQTNEKIIKKGDDRGDIVINETVYYRAVYGFNSVKRTYVIKLKSK